MILLHLKNTDFQTADVQMSYTHSESWHNHKKIYVFVMINFVAVLILEIEVASPIALKIISKQFSFQTLT